MTKSNINDMVGCTFVRVEGLEVQSATVVFVADTGDRCKFYHELDCREDVFIEDVCGNVSDLVGSPIVLAEEVSDYDFPAPKDADSYTWTFYRFATVKGTVTVRWLGTSTGYYSESVDFAWERTG